jgi:histidyl-tRNA synthetase
VPAAAPDVYAVVPDVAALPVVMATLEALRASGLQVLMHAGGKDGQGSFKSQFKKADASGARFALVFGADELAKGQVTIKPLRDAAAQQRVELLNDLAVWASGLRGNA